MKKKDRKECWDIIWKTNSCYRNIESDGLTLAQQERINKALDLAYKKGKKSKEPKAIRVPYAKPPKMR